MAIAYVGPNVGFGFITVDVNGTPVDRQNITSTPTGDDNDDFTDARLLWAHGLLQMTEYRWLSLL